MTEKQKILAAVQQTMPEDVSIDRLWLMRKIEIAQGQADRGEGVAHEDLLQELLDDDAQS